MIPDISGTALALILVGVIGLIILGEYILSRSNDDY